MIALKHMNKFSKFCNGEKLYTEKFYPDSEYPYGATIFREGEEIDVRFNLKSEPQKIMGVSIVKTFVDEADLIPCKPILKDVK